MEVVAQGNQTAVTCQHVICYRSMRYLKVMLALFFVQDFLADILQLAHNLRIHTVTEQPLSSCLFKYGIVLASR